MLDPRYIRENTELVRQALADRQDTAPVDEILELNTQRRQKVSQLDNLRQQRKVLSKERHRPRRRDAPSVPRFKTWRKRSGDWTNSLRNYCYRYPISRSPMYRWVGTKAITSWYAPGESRGNSILSRPHTGSWGKTWALSTSSAA